MVETIQHGPLIQCDEKLLFFGKFAITLRPLHREEPLRQRKLNSRRALPHLCPHLPYAQRLLPCRTAHPPCIPQAFCTPPSVMTLHAAVVSSLLSVTSSIAAAPFVGLRLHSDAFTSLIKQLYLPLFWLNSQFFTLLSCPVLSNIYSPDGQLCWPQLPPLL